MKRGITPLRVLLGIVVLLFATLLALYRWPSDQYLLTVDPAHPLAPYVHVQGAHPAGTGELFFVDVHEEQANQLDLLFPWLHPHSTLLPASDFVPPGSTSQEADQAALREMATSQRIAAAVALRRLGYHVIGAEDGVLVDNVYGNVPAAAKVFPADVIVAADGKPTLTVAALHAALAPVKPGQTVDLRIRRGSRVVAETVKTIADPNEPHRAFIGIIVERHAKIRLPIRVSINLGAVGGPSAGLVFALEVMQQLGHDVTHGHKIAATGELSLNGSVLPIGGVEQKTWGARDAGADVFLVPAGQNAQDARKYAGPMKIIAVTSFAQALHALATLPPAR